jgi:hypothetical protein
LVRNLLKARKVPRWRWILLIAIVSDAIGFGLALIPPAQWLLDAATAFALLIAMGFRWPLLLALGVEVVPVLQVFPAWTLVVLAMAAAEKGQPIKGTTTPGTEPKELESNSSSATRK